ncbi:hypothetical protein EV361DRAFT_872291 [Lentinula raphanica]|nr:hypothetical protein EV361DRAFT_872291 [Lentinula raphanica]
MEKYHKLRDVLKDVTELLLYSIPHLTGNYILTPEFQQEVQRAIVEGTVHSVIDTGSKWYPSYDYKRGDEVRMKMTTEYKDRNSRLLLTEHWLVGARWVEKSESCKKYTASMVRDVPGANYPRLPLAPKKKWKLWPVMMCWCWNRLPNLKRNEQETDHRPSNGLDGSTLVLPHRIGGRPMISWQISPTNSESCPLLQTPNVSYMFAFVGHKEIEGSTVSHLFIHDTTQVSLPRIWSLWGSSAVVLSFWSEDVWTSNACDLSSSNWQYHDIILTTNTPTDKHFSLSHEAVEG